MSPPVDDSAIAIVSWRSLSNAPSFSASGNRSCIGVYLLGRRTPDYSRVATQPLAARASIAMHAWPAFSGPSLSEFHELPARFCDAEMHHMKKASVRDLR